MSFNSKSAMTLCFMMVFAIVALPIANAQNVPATTAPTPATHTAAPPIVIGAGDLLHISVLGAPEFERDARVDDAGKVSLPMVGDVLLADMSVSSAQDAIAAKLSKGGFYVEPQVSILVKEYATQGISVLGEVQKPGIYPLLGAHTLFDAISAAGGTSAKAGRTVSITHRNHEQPTQTVELSYTSEGSIKSNVEIQPGDTVVVSKAGMVYVVGDVHLPTGILLENPNLTVLQALSMAQGPNGTAALDRSKVLRKTATGTLEIPVPLKQMLAAKKPDMPLQPEDVLFVPNSVAKGAARRTFEAAMQTLTGVVIYGSRRY